MGTTKFKGKWIPWLFLLPTLAILLVFLYYPVVQTFRLSFYRVAFLGLKTKWAGLDNYINLAQDSGYHHTVWVTIVIGAAVVVLGLGTSLAIAMLANQFACVLCFIELHHHNLIEQTLRRAFGEWQY